jgi:hypothetical protein
MPGPDNTRKNLEFKGWLSLLLIMFLFPILFFLCVYFPVWLGVASPY